MICRQFQKVYGPSPKFPSTYRGWIVISFGHDGPIKQDIIHPESRLSGLLQSPPLRRTQPDISSPLFMTLWEETTPCPSTLVIQTGIQLTVQGTGNTNKRHFRLPTGILHSPHLYTSGLTPSQAEDIKFETCLASYSNDKLNSINTNSRKMMKEERRRSKDDAWVDILVVSHSYHAGNQDADVRCPRGP